MFFRLKLGLSPTYFPLFTCTNFLEVDLDGLIVVVVLPNLVDDVGLVFETIQKAGRVVLANQVQLVRSAMFQSTLTVFMKNKKKNVLV
jgi:hypothetical protein